MKTGFSSTQFLMVLGAVLAISIVLSSPAQAQTDSIDNAVAEGRRIKVIYEGFVEGTLQIEDRSRGVNLRFGNYSQNIGGTRTIPVTGNYRSEVIYDGIYFTAVDYATYSAREITHQQSPISGTRSGNTCRILETDGNHRDGLCSLDYLIFEKTTVVPQATVILRYNARAIEVVDLSEQERIATERRAEIERQAEIYRLQEVQRQREAAAYLQSRPRANSAQTTLLDRAIAQDSQAWFINRFDQGSLTDVVVLPPPDAGVVLVRGSYTYNGGSLGWVNARLRGTSVECLEYWDRQGSCAAVRSAPAASASPSRMREGLAIEREIERRRHDDWLNWRANQRQ